MLGVEMGGWRGKGGLEGGGGVGGGCVGAWVMSAGYKRGLRAWVKSVGTGWEWEKSSLDFVTVST